MTCCQLELYRRSTNKAIRDLTDRVRALENAMPIPEMYPLFYVREQYPIGEFGPITTAGVDTSRKLNTIIANEIDATMEGDAMVLPAGEYLIQARAPAANTGSHRLRAYTFQGGVNLVIGPSALAGANNQTDAILMGTFEVAAQTTVYLFHYTQLAGGYLGVPTNRNTYGEFEVYAEVRVWKLA